MYELKQILENVFTSKFVGTGPSSYKKRIYRAAVSQRLRNTALVHCGITKAYIYLAYSVGVCMTIIPVVDSISSIYCR